MPRSRRRSRRDMEIQSPDDLSYAKVLVHGPPGAGKTRLLATAQDDERTSPMLFLAFEAGTRTLVGKDIDVVKCRTFGDFDEPYEILSSPDHGGYRSVGVDSITEVQIEGMLDIIGDSGLEDAMDQPGWGRILTQMRRFTRKFKDLDMHVFFTALSKESSMPRIGTVQVPAIQGSFSVELPGMVDTVAYLAQEDVADGEVQRVLLLRDWPKFSVKARSAWDVTPPAELEAPTVGRLLDALGF